MGKAITLTTKQICAGFGISHVTAYNWRKGGSQDKLPVIDPEAREVRFGLADTQAWAKANGKPFSKEKALAAVPTSATDGPKSKPLPKSEVDKKKAKILPRTPAERLAAKPATKKPKKAVH